MEKTIGEIKMNIEFIKGNNSIEQNQDEAFAHLYNRLEKIKNKKKSVKIELAQKALEIANYLVKSALK